MNAKSKALNKKKEVAGKMKPDAYTEAKKWGDEYRASKKVSMHTSQDRAAHEKKYGRENW